MKLSKDERQAWKDWTEHCRKILEAEKPSPEELAKRRLARIHFTNDLIERSMVYFVPPKNGTPEMERLKKDMMVFKPK